MNIRKFLLCLFCGIVIISFKNDILKAEALEVSAYSAVVIEADTGRVIFEKNSTERLAMASTTKIMTALLTLESSNLDDFFIVSPDAIKVEGTSMGLKEGDRVTLRTLAAGMLLASGNDAANSAAVKIAGSIEEFAIMMNRRARLLKMNDTNFVTPSGLDDSNHYSTAYDMAKLARAALNNPDFMEICSQKTMKLNYGNPPYTRWLSNHNKLLKSYEGCIGVKTGFTKKAGRCLVSAAERNGVRIIVVTLKAPNDWQDHKKLLDYGFSKVELIELSDEIKVEIPVVGGEKNEVTAVVKTIPEASILKEDLLKIDKKVISEPFLYAPVKKGDIIGEVHYCLNGEAIKKTFLIASDDVKTQMKKISFFDKIKRFFNRKDI